MIIVNQTYAEERLDYFTSLMHKARRKYHRYLKRFGSSPYGSDENIMLSDAARDVHFCADIVEMLEKQIEGEWVSVDDRLPDERQVVLVYRGVFRGDLRDIYTYLGSNNWEDAYENHASTEDDGITHWMPLPEPPKMKGGAE